MCALVAVLSAQNANGFVSPTPLTQRRLSMQRRLPSLQMMGWDEVVFNAESVASSFASRSLEDPTAVWSSLPIMYGAGLLTSISPCVWGLLPLTTSYISAAAGEREDKQALLPTLAFAAGLASVFCSLGLVASFFGGVFGASSGNVSDILVPLFSSGICFVMGLQLLGLIELPLLNFQLPMDEPTDKDTPILLDGQGNMLNTPSKSDGSLLRTFFLGGSSALVASPCATPVLTSILGYVAKTQNPVVGMLLLLGYTLGYSTPLLLVAASGGQALANLKGEAYGKIAPWVTPFTAGILLWYGTNGLLTALFGDPSMAGLAPILE
jgi:cytochrome c-type biogenesis protein